MFLRVVLVVLCCQLPAFQLTWDNVPSVTPFNKFNNKHSSPTPPTNHQQHHQQSTNRPPPQLFQETGSTVPILSKAKNMQSSTPATNMASDKVPLLPPYGSMNKAACLLELQKAGYKTDSQWSLQEVRQMIKDWRVEQGLLKPTSTDDPTKAMKMSKDKLYEECLRLGLDPGKKPIVGIMHSLLRLHHENATDGQTVMGFGKYSLMTFEEVLQEQESYVTWALKEVSESQSPGFGLTRFCKWVHRTKPSNSSTSLPQEPPPVKTDGTCFEQSMGKPRNLTSPTPGSASRSKANASSKEKANADKLKEMELMMNTMREEMEMLRGTERKKGKSSASGTSDDYTKVDAEL
jgi:hypothetical protein